MSHLHRRSIWVRSGCAILLLFIAGMPGLCQIGSPGGYPPGGYPPGGTPGGTYPDGGDVTHYFKYGVYNTASATAYTGCFWRDARFFSGGVSAVVLDTTAIYQLQNQASGLVLNRRRRMQRTNAAPRDF